MRVTAIGDMALTTTPGGACRPSCQVSEATARLAQPYAPVSAGRQPEPEVTPRMRPWPAAAMIGRAALEDVEVAVEVHVEHAAPVLLGAARRSWSAG